MYPSSNCQFTVDSFDRTIQDTFPTRLVAAGAMEVIDSCLFRRSGGDPTIGAQVVGPKRGIMVIVGSKIATASGRRTITLGINQTQILLHQARSELSV